ncbi:MAG: hypothetical protein WD355_04930 [Balneolaceae bacterium]
MNEQDIAINYTREAFLHPLNLILLFGTTLSAFLLSDFGSLSNLMLTMVFGTELAYLGIIPRLPGFKRRIRIKKLRARDSGEEEKLIFRQLEPKLQRRFLVLKHLSNVTGENFEKLPYTSQGLLENIRKKMAELLSNYMTLLDLYKRYEIYMNSAVEEGLKQEVERMKGRIEELESERLKSTKERRLQILEKRLRKFDLAKEKYLICETHLETIEDAVRFIYEQSMTMHNAEDIGFQLDNLMSEVEETSQLIEDLDQEILPEYEMFEREIQPAAGKQESAASGYSEREEKVPGGKEQSHE